MFCLGFNPVEGRWRPLSDVELLMHLQEEYNSTRYLYAEARKEAIPVRLYRKGGELEAEDLEAIANRKPRQLIGVSGNPQIPINQDVMQLDGVKIDPAAYDVSLIRNDMDMMVGLSDASRANLIQAKTATEAQIMAQSLANRQSERQDAIEDLISEMAEAALQIMLQRFSLLEVQQIVGRGAVWPEDAGPELWTKIRVKVRAGSSGKPNQAKEREDWAQIMPVINEAMTKVAELRAAGHGDMANSVIELAKETLRRFDERIDIDRFIPREAGQNGEQDVGQLMMQVQQLQQQLAECQQALQECQGELEKAKMQEQAKIVELNAKAAAEERQAQADAATKLAEINNRSAAEQERARQEAMVKAEQERAKAAEAEAKKVIETARIEADAELQKYNVLTKAAVELISKLGIVPGTHGVQGSMGDLIDSASMAIQGVMNGKASIAAGGRPAEEPEEDDAEGESKAKAKSGGTKRMKVQGPGGKTFEGEVKSDGKRKTIRIKRPDGQEYTGVIEES